MANKLEQYIKDNQEKSKSQNLEKPTPSLRGSSKNALGFFTFVRLLNGVFISRFFIIGLLVFGIGSYQKLGSNGWPVPERIFWLGAGALGLLSLYTLYYILQYIRYRKFLAGIFYPVKGWSEFIAGLSPSFWKYGSRYVYVRLTIGLESTATALHIQATEIFLEKCIKRWGSGHTGKWTKGSPANFKREGLSLVGHICIFKGMQFLVRTLLYRLPAFATMIGPNKMHLSVSSRGEQSFDTEEEEDPYEAERERKWRESV
jgi:hypothetical protein